MKREALASAIDTAPRRTILAFTGAGTVEGMHLMQSYLRLSGSLVAATGLFCPTALVLLGRILLELSERRQRGDAAGRPGGHEGDWPST